MPRLVLALALLAACEHGQTPIETAIVSPLQTPCVFLDQQMCMTMVPDQKPMETLFFGIEGFTHRWGIESEIKFRREPVDPRPIEGPSENLILLEIVVENETVTAPFQLQFPPGSGWFIASGTTLDLHGTTVTCDPAVCDQLISLDSATRRCAIS
jgi:hypothetical protein